MPRILVVDDEPDILEVMCNWLALRHYDVLAAANSAEAVRLASAEKPDLILLDASMPGVGGIETCRTLRAGKQTRHVPIILVTGSDPISGRIDALVAGADDYVTRPVILNSLGTRIHSLLSNNGIPKGSQARLPDEVTETVLAMLSCDLVWLFAADEGEEALVSTAAATHWPPATAPSLQETITLSFGEAGRLGQAATSRIADLNLSPLQLSNGPRQVLKVCEDLDLAYISLFPLHNKGMLLGILLAGGRSPQNIETADGRQRITAAISQVTIALENAHLARLLAEAKPEAPALSPVIPIVDSDNKSQYLDTLWRTLEDLQKAASLDEALRAILNQAVRMLDINLAMILLLTDRMGDDLTVYAAAGLYARRLSGVRIPRSGIVGVVLNERMPLIVNDAQLDPHFMLGFDEQWGFQAETILAAPLSIEDETIGVLEAVNKNGEKFAPSDQDILQGLACLASLVIEKRRLTTALAGYAASHIAHDPAKTEEVTPPHSTLDPAKTEEVIAKTSPGPDKVSRPGLRFGPSLPEETAEKPYPNEGRVPTSTELLELILDITNPSGDVTRHQPIGEPASTPKTSEAGGLTRNRESGQIKTAPLPPLEEVTRSAREPIVLHQSIASLEYVAQSAIESVRSLADVSGIDLVGIFDDFLPDIYIDRGRILDVIETLLEGAIGASEQGDHVKCVIRNGAEALQIRITYQNVDLPLGDFASIQRIIEQHGGQFGIDTIPDKGTSFRFTLPKIEVTGMGDFLPAF
jgi:DNA-binding response OmpR family regulator